MSCVSGGSIIGTHYYLEVKKILEEKNDGDVTKNDYIEIVQRIEKEFLEGVQRNIRVRVAAKLTNNLRMIFFSNFSRTKRAGELYEEEIFSRVNDKQGCNPLYMDDLFIKPLDNNGKEDPIPIIFSGKK